MCIIVITLLGGGMIILDGVVRHIFTVIFIEKKKLIGCTVAELMIIIFFNFNIVLIHFRVFQQAHYLRQIVIFIIFVFISVIVVIKG